MTFRKQFVVTTTSSGEIVLTGGSNETFAASSNSDYIIQIITAGSAIGGSSNTAAAGDLVSLTASTTPAQTFVVSGNTLTITNAEVLGNGAKVKVIATLTKTLSAEKTKTNQPCQLVLVDADATSGAEYGTASQHKEISLGRADYYKLYAVLDSEDASTNPELPKFTVTGVSGTFTKGETITGVTSGCSAKIINGKTTYRELKPNHLVTSSTLGAGDVFSAEHIYLKTVHRSLNELEKLTRATKASSNFLISKNRK